MDSLTHLVAGTVTPVAFAHAPKRTSLLVFGIMAAQLPDIDVFFGRSAEFLLTQHRGFTHAFVMQPFLALALAIPFAIWMRKKPKCSLAPEGQVCQDFPAHPHTFSLGKLFIIALFAIFMHSMLDMLNGFGTMALLPFSDMRLGINAVFIVDLLLTLPPLILMVWMLRLPAVPAPEAVKGSWLKILRDPVKKEQVLPGHGFFSAKAQLLAKLSLIWIIVYALLAIATKIGLEALYTRAWDLGPDKKVSLMAEPFSPFAWKAIIEDGQIYKMATLYPLGSKSLSLPADDAEWDKLMVADKTFYATLEKQAPFFTYFKKFAPDMHQIILPGEIETTGPYSGQNISTYIFGDMRYVMSPKSAAHYFQHSDANFLLEARVMEDGTLLEYRFLNRGKDSAETPWEKP